MKNTPAYRQEWMLEELNKEPLMSSGKMRDIYGKKWNKGKTTFDKDWAKVREMHADYQRKLQKAKEKASINYEVRAVKSGLKKKIDRLLLLQENIGKILREIDNNKCEETKLINGTPITYERQLTPNERATLHRTLKELQAEISKIEGDYAPQEQQVEIRRGIDVTRLSNDTLREIAHARTTDD